jgi:hypothetical protein
VVVGNAVRIEEVAQDAAGAVKNPSDDNGKAATAGSLYAESQRFSASLAANAQVLRVNEHPAVMSCTSGLYPILLTVREANEDARLARAAL